MCEYISGRTLMPGWGCCSCRTYNGLQRKECRGCGKESHQFKVPGNVVRCPGCGYGIAAGQTADHTLTGRDVRGVCPCCGQAWQEAS